MDTLVAKCSEREIRFVLEYLVSYSGTKAALAAGYSKKSAGVQGQKTLARPRVKKLIEALRKRDIKEFEIQRHEILWNLWACAVRNGKQFVDERGKLLITSQNINDLPDEVTAAIDSIKQRRKVFHLEDGSEVEEIETEVKLVPKAAALEMAMKHKGLFAAEKTDVKVSLDFDQLYRDNKEVIDIDPIERRLLEEKERQ